MSFVQIDTLLELYDARIPLLNITGTWHLQPKNVIFFYYDLEDAAFQRKQLAQMFSRIGLSCNVRL